MSVLLECMPVYLVPAEARRHIRYPGTGITDDCDLPCFC